MLQAIKTRMIVKPEPKPTVDKGIIVPDSVQVRIRTGIVISCGNEVDDSIEVGMRIAFNPVCPELLWNDETYCWVDQQDILGIDTDHKSDETVN